jgi:gliding motility-associated lipoprotein GldH
MNKFIRAKGTLFIKWSLFCFFFLILAGCLNEPLYEKNIPINSYLWNHQQAPEFKVYIANTNQRLDLFLNLRHTAQYKYSNLSLIVEEVNPKNQEKRYHLEFQLTTPDGRWKGLGTGNILSHQVQFLNDHHFADTGEYTFRIKQNMRINPLPEIVDIGIKVVNGKVIASK